jgi:hypothetical protein
MIPTNTRADFGAYAQDRWTVDRWTLGGGVRFDYFNSYEPAVTIGASPLTPNRHIELPQTDVLAWKDITPKLGATYDIFGDTKTALRISLNKYVTGQASGGLATVGPAANLVTSTTRPWRDDNRDDVPNCDLTFPLANGECGPMANANFGQSVPGTVYDPNVLRGWNHRGFSWEFATSIEREVAPKLSVNGGYFRRWYGNFIVTDNLAIPQGLSGFGQFSIAVPNDSRLNSSGQTIAGFYNLNPQYVGQVNNYVTFADAYGKQIEHWNGVDVGASTRPAPGLVFQGGVSAGRTVTDNCAIMAQVPEAATPQLVAGSTSASPLAYCHQQTALQTQVKGFGSYTIRKVDVQLSGAFQSVPGPLLLANYVASNAQLLASLGRNLSGNAPNVTVNLIAPGTMYGDRLNQLDVRLGKLFRIGETRSTISFDVFNVMNANPVLTESQNYSNFRQPSIVLPARLFKVSAQFDF